MEDFAKALREHTQDDAKHFDALTDILADMQQDLKEMKGNLAPLSEAYNGVIFGKKLLTGVAAVVLAISAIGGGIIWLVMSIVNSHVK